MSQNENGGPITAPSAKIAPTSHWWEPGLRIKNYDLKVRGTVGCGAVVTFWAIGKTAALHPGNCHFRVGPNYINQNEVA